MACPYCSGLMRPINQDRGRLVLYWCPLCHRFLEAVRRRG